MPQKSQKNLICFRLQGLKGLKKFNTTILFRFLKLTKLLTTSFSFVEIYTILF